MDFKDQLIAERHSLQQRIDAINIALQAYGVSTDQVLSSDSESKAISNIFPIRGSREKKIQWILSEYFKRSVRLPEIQKAYDDHNGTESSIDNFCRNLKKEGKLVFVKYNGRNKLCYWGLPEWIEGNNFAESRMTDDPELPKIFSSEIQGKE